MGEASTLGCRLAIERVYDRHRLWPAQNPGRKPPFDEPAVAASLREQIAMESMQRAALREKSGLTISPEMVQGEMNRLGRETRDAGMLRELFAALADDPGQIAQCLALPLLTAQWQVTALRSGAAPAGADSPAACTEDFSDLALVHAAYHLPEIHPEIAASPDAVDAACNSWAATSPLSPAARSHHSAVWTGTEMIVWGGVPDTNTGSRYTPATNAWSATQSLVNVPAARGDHTAIWTGGEMIIWGGEASGFALNSGGRYNPSTNAWTTVSTGAGVPAARTRHSAVWSGGVMIVWGGCTDGTCATPLNSGSRYSPAGNSWIATAAAPVARGQHSAVWTGTAMIVWGGVIPDITFGTVIDNGGARYNLAGNSWLATSLTNAPAARAGHSSVWTGTEMIVWGGGLNSGGRYNPAGDSWRATSTGANVPAARFASTAVWTGGEMIVWGGTAGGAPFNTGGRYSPATDLWTAVTTTGAPPGRNSHTAVWAVDLMIVWGGESSSTIQLSDGSRYGLSMPAISAQPAATTACSGGGASFSVAATNTTTWQWYKDGVALTNGAVYSGVTTSTLTLTGAGAAQAGVYVALVGNSCTTLLSNPAALTVVSGSAPSGLANNSAVDASVCAASGITIAWSAPSAWNDSSAGLRSFSVLRGGSPVASGPCAGSLAVSTVNCTDTSASPGTPYTYTLRATNGCNLSATTSPGATATDNSDLLPPAMSTQKGSKVSGNLLLDWTTGAPVDAVSYKSYSQTVPNPATWTLRNTTAASSWTDTVDLGTATTLFFTTTAIDACANESPK